MSPANWPTTWTGRWIWDQAPEPAAWWAEPAPRPGRAVYLRTSVEVGELPAAVPARLTCDSRYLLWVNGAVVARGPVRAEPSHLGWDEVDLAPWLRRGANAVVALCRYYGTAGPWWVPAPQAGELGAGSFCLETRPGSPVTISTGPHWWSRRAPWSYGTSDSWYGLPPEIVDGRGIPADLHDPRPAAEGWQPAVVLACSLGGPRDRPPAPPYTAPSRRRIPQLAGVTRSGTPIGSGEIPAPEPAAEPLQTWTRRPAPAGSPHRRITVFDLGELTLGHVRLAVRGGGQPGGPVDLTCGERLRDDGLPEPEPRRWAARYLLAGAAAEELTFFDPVGARYVAVDHPDPLTVEVTVEESLCPRPAGAAFDCDDAGLTALWRAGLRTVELCSTDAFVDCPGREQRAWVGDAHVAALVWLVASPDTRLVRHTLELSAHSRRPDGLLAMAAGCDLSRAAVTIPDYSLLWIRTLAAYWRHTGDKDAVAALLPTAHGIIERYETYIGGSGLLEDVPGWVFLDWARLERGPVIGAHDALYALALREVSELPGAGDIGHLPARTAAAFEQLWDPAKGAYRDNPAGAGRISQHTNAAALAAGLVPATRRAGVLRRITEPSAHGGRLVVTMTEPDTMAQTLPPEGFDPDVDVVACEPVFARVLHEAMAACGRVDLVLDSHRRWLPFLAAGTLPELWTAGPAVSTCHGWSATPTFDLARYVLGVRPVEPGYRRVEIAPVLGRLRGAAGRVATPHGWLGVRAGQESVTVTVPDGVLAQVAGREVGPGTHTLPGRFTGAGGDGGRSSAVVASQGVDGV